eukprot:NODE_5337_length_414_cov_86.726027_g4658_i0.p2 GENE.NODE_5337_length_414_cov_86.726027_g4658_i0~~NODE_5337_length_414_cov_86.726027_g4658_i0.p2  ORF type:complete len:55 (+),score=1.88 NODE_5337_length_414_cov_86.726027_g4658_i0:213-377(+)
MVRHHQQCISPSFVFIVDLVEPFPSVCSLCRHWCVCAIVGASCMPLLYVSLFST